MFKLLKGGQCYAPEYMGKKDILVACSTICKIDGDISAGNLWDVEVIDCEDRIVCPGFIDQHVHITGGGGEGGPVSRVPELMLSEITTSGVTTLVGVLGVDSITRNIAGLLTKSRALEEEGLTSYIYTGSYGIPTATLTGRVISDIALIDKVIGVGEIAISDYRSTQPAVKMLEELAYEAKVGGLLGSKAGVMHIHVGDGKSGLSPLLDLLDDSDFPVEMFVPTHLNRNKFLFEQAINYIQSGGNMDITAGETSKKGYSVPDAIEILVDRGINMDKVTVSSDGNGSTPANGGNTGICKMDQLFKDIRACILDKKLDTESVLKTVTSNVSKVLKLYPRKGALRVGSDADILVVDRKNLSIDSILLKGTVHIRGGRVLRKGRYEKNEYMAFDTTII